MYTRSILSIPAYDRYAFIVFLIILWEFSFRTLTKSFKLNEEAIDVSKYLLLNAIYTYAVMQFEWKGKCRVG